MPAEEAFFTEIGAFEAKTKLSEILRKVDLGESFTITVRGRAVAQLTPLRASSSLAQIEESEAAFQRLLNPAIFGITNEQIQEAIAEGRR